MSELFKDKEFEKLDDLSKLVEPISWEFLSEFEALPERIDISNGTLNGILQRHLAHYMYQDSRDIPLNDFLANFDWYQKLDVQERNVIHAKYEFGMEGTLRMNLNAGVLEGDGKLFIHKTSTSFTEQELKDLMGYKLILESGLGRTETNETVERLKEILDILNPPDKAKTRSFERRKDLLRSTLSKIFKEDLWKIRSIDLSNKLCVWVYDYIRTGNVSSLANFCKLKAMTHKSNGNGIYSIKEEE